MCNYDLSTKSTTKKEHIIGFNSVSNLKTKNALL